MIATRGTLWPHQSEAVDAALATLNQHPRTSVIAACGSGKTRIGAEIAARTVPDGGRLLIVAPTLELVAQTLHEYRTVFGDLAVGRLIAVCSRHDAIYHNQVDLDAEHAEVTTDPRLLAQLMSAPGRYTVASTYQSLSVLREAHAQHGLAPWSLITIDEAHRTAGARDRPWAVIHDDDAIPAARRLYLTATPRVLAESDDERALSMDEKDVFGPVSYNLSFADAIERGLLANYRVVVPVVTDQEIHRLLAASRQDATFLATGRTAVSPDMLAVQVAVLRAAAQHQVRRIISYHNTVDGAEAFANTLHNALGLLAEHERPADLFARHVSGQQRVRKRRPILSRLASEDPGVVLVSNARVLSEGVNIPAVDAVVFVDARDSTEMTVQAVGRALRTGGRTDKVATIIVPVILTPGQTPEAALEGSDFAPVWRTIRALRAHDDRLAVRLDKMRFDLGADRYRPAEHGQDGELPHWLRVSGIPVPPGFADAITLQMVRSTSAPFEEMLGRATAYFERTGTLTPAQHEDPELADWLRYQRSLRTRGMLPDERIRQLDRIAMIWIMPDHRSAQQLSLARAFRETYGHLDVPENAELGNPPKPLGRWLSKQRARYHEGRLPPDLTAALEELGIDWQPAASPQGRAPAGSPSRAEPTGPVPRGQTSRRSQAAPTTNPDRPTRGHQALRGGAPATATAFDPETRIQPIISQLIDARRTQGLSQAALAVRLGVTEITMTEWETRAGNPLVEHLLSWLRELGFALQVGQHLEGEAPRPLATLALGTMSDERAYRATARALRQARRSAGILQHQVAEALGVSTWTVRQWEAANRHPLLRHLFAWAETVGCHFALPNLDAAEATGQAPTTAADRLWLTRLDLLCAYQVEHGGALPTARTRQTLSGAPPTNLYSFLTAQRRAYRRGALTERQITLLDTLGPRWAGGRRG